MGIPIRPSIYENIDLLTNTDAVNISTISIRYLGNHSLEWEIIKNLKLKSSVGLDYNDYREREFFNNKTNIGTSIAPLLGFRSEANTANIIFQNEQLLTYVKNIGDKHNFSGILGNSIQTTTLGFLRAQGQGFANNDLQQIASASVRTSSQNQSKSTLASFFGRVNYNYLNKYFIEASLRADGSSKFGTNNRWGYFPAAGISWRAKQESFLANKKYLNELKVRASVGSAGNQNGINDYGARGLWTGNVSYPDSLTGGFRPGLAPLQLENPELRWEKTTTYNAGVDIGLFNRLYITLDAYYKYTTDVLLPLPIPRATGFTSILSNAGIVSNQGIELSVSSTNIKTKNFEWTTNFNIAHNKNRAEKLINPITFEAREYRRTEEGAPLGSYWLYKQLYVDPQTGNAVFDDVDKDGKLTQADRQLLGNVLPDFFGGLTNTFSYKGVSLNIFFTYQYGNELFNFNRYILEGGGTRDASRSILKSQLDRWQKPGDITNTPRVTSVGDNYNIEQNSRYLEDASFIRLKSVNLSYSLPSSLTSKVGLGKVTLYATGTNLLVFTKYSGPDPEASGSAIQNLDGLDTATPPQPIGLLFGAKINF